MEDECMSEQNVRCRNCGRLISADDKFCPHCGAINAMSFRMDPNKNYCRFCGNELSDGARECPICGTAVSSGTAQSESVDSGYTFLSRDDQNEKAAAAAQAARNAAALKAQEEAE